MGRYRCALGELKDAPAPIDWPPDGWQIKPDVVVQGPRLDVPATGLVEWTWVVIPSPFTEDTWITSVELRPSNPRVTHHSCLALGPHKPGMEYGKPIWQDKQRDANGDEIDPRKGIGGTTGGAPAGHPASECCWRRARGDAGDIAGSSGIVTSKWSDWATLDRQRSFLRMFTTYRLRTAIQVLDYPYELYIQKDFSVG